MSRIRSVMGRRQFLITAGAASTSVLATKKLKGLFQPVHKSGVAKASDKPGNAAPKYTRTLKADVVVLGSGAAGMTAAITAKQQGVKKVVILEKRAEVGGNSVFAPVPAIDNTRSEDIFNKANENANWRADARIIGTVIDNSKKIHEWLKSSRRGVQRHACEDSEGPVREAWYSNHLQYGG
jgi:hypothetical protein